jgi:phosphomannomutase
MIKVPEDRDEMALSVRELLAESGVVIGYDSRPGSKAYAQLMAATLHYHFELVRTYVISNECT